MLKDPEKNELLLTAIFVIAHMQEKSKAKTRPQKQTLNKIQKPSCVQIQKEKKEEKLKKYVKNKWNNRRRYSTFWNSKLLVNTYLFIYVQVVQNWCYYFIYLLLRIDYRIELKM